MQAPPAMGRSDGLFVAAIKRVGKLAKAQKVPRSLNISRYMTQKTMLGKQVTQAAVNAYAGRVDTLHRKWQQGNESASGQRADGEIEQCEVACAPLELQFGPDGPNVALP